VTGRKSGSVWAYAHELDAWLNRGARPSTTIPGEGVDDAGIDARAARLSGSGRVILAVCAVLAAVAAGVTTQFHTRPTPGTPAQALPADPALADIYLQARDDWSTRSPQGLRRAMSEFGEVTGRDPRFAPAYAGLADVYIAARDYAAMPDSIAFPNADAAARASLAIDPNSADAYRVLGFVNYWYRHDIRAAREHFERALQIQPNSAQTHLWFGSTLLAIGAYDESLRELRIARVQEPGSKVIEMFCAWALWLRGPGDPGLGRIDIQRSQSMAAARWMKAR